MSTTAAFTAASPAASPAPAPGASPGRRLLSTVAVFALAFGAAVVLLPSAQRLGWLPGGAPAGAAQPGWPDTAATSGAPVWVAPPLPSRPPLAWQGAAPAAQPLPVQVAAPAARWRTTLWMGGQAYPLRSGSMALPTGASFHVELASLPAGEVAVYAVNGRGEGSGQPLWAARVAAGGSAWSPALRLDGLRGLETLHVVHRGADGTRRTERLRLWHL